MIKNLSILPFFFACMSLLAQPLIIDETYSNRVFREIDNFDASYLNTLEQAFHHTEIDTVRFAILKDLAYYWHTRNLERADSLSRMGIQMTEEANNLLWKGRLQTVHGAILLRAEKLDTATMVLEEARNYVLKSDLPLLLTQLGYVAERRGDLALAAEYAEQNLKLGEAINDLWAQAMAYSDLSNLFWKQNKPKEGLEYGLISQQLFENRGIEDMDYGFTLYVIGNNHLAMGQNEEALAYYQKAIESGEKYGFYNNLVDVYISLIDLYTAMGDHDAALDIEPQAIKYAKLLNNAFLRMRIHLSTGRTYNLLGEHSQAIESLQTCLQIATENFGDEFWLQQAYKELSFAHAKEGNYKTAYNHFVEYDQLKDSIFTAEADRRIAELQTEFDTVQKQATIELQKEQIAQTQTRQLLISVVAFFLLLVSLILYRNHRINRRKNVILEKQNEEKAFLLKEIHHRVKNNLQILSSLLNLQTDYIKDESALDAVKEGLGRVDSMGLIHQKLYVGDNVAAVNMREYVRELSEHLIDSYIDDEARISISSDVKIEEIDVDMAIPLGLIINELITNSVKYAFPNGQSGHISIKLWNGGPQKLYLRVADNGVGKQGSQKLANSTSFGTDLINILCQKFQGEISHESDKGFSTLICFPQN